MAVNASDQQAAKALRQLLVDLQEVVPADWRGRLEQGLSDISVLSVALASSAAATAAQAAAPSPERDAWAVAPFASPQRPSKSTAGDGDGAGAATVDAGDAASREKEPQAPAAAAAAAAAETVSAVKAKATLCFTAKDFSGALNHCDRCVALEPDEATHYANRSLAKLRLGDARGAEADARHSVSLRPGWGRAHYRLGCALAAVGGAPAMADALAALEQSLALEPESSATRHAWAEAKAKQEANAEAEAAGQRAAKRATSDEAEVLKAFAAASAEAEAAKEARSNRLFTPNRMML